MKVEIKKEMRMTQETVSKEAVFAEMEGRFTPLLTRENIYHVSMIIAAMVGEGLDKKQIVGVVIEYFNFLLVEAPGDITQEAVDLYQKDGFIKTITAIYNLAAILRKLPPELIEILHKEIKDVA